VEDAWPRWLLIGVSSALGGVIGTLLGPLLWAPFGVHVSWRVSKTDPIDE
jgi:uncharacterized protein YaaW (UPF0174 family)